MTDRQKLEKIKNCVERLEGGVKLAEVLAPEKYTHVAWGKFLEDIANIIIEEE